MASRTACLETGQSTRYLLRVAVSMIWRPYGVGRTWSVANRHGLGSKRSRCKVSGWHKYPRAYSAPCPSRSGVRVERLCLLCTCVPVHQAAPRSYDWPQIDQSAGFMIASTRRRATRRTTYPTAAWPTCARWTRRTCWSLVWRGHFDQGRRGPLQVPSHAGVWQGLAWDQLRVSEIERMV